jgi:hypothetical protein
VLRGHGDRRTPGDEVPARHFVEQAAGVLEAAELAVATKEEVGEKEVRDSLDDDGQSARRRAEAVAGEA